MRNQIASIGINQSEETYLLAPKSLYKGEPLYFLFYLMFLRANPGKKHCNQDLLSFSLMFLRTILRTFLFSSILSQHKSTSLFFFDIFFSTIKKLTLRVNENISFLLYHKHFQEYHISRRCEAIKHYMTVNCKAKMNM